MTTIGSVESLWRFPVKGMSGQEMSEIFVGFSGVFGDRCYAFKSSSARKGFPYFNAVAHEQMVCYHPQFRHPELAAGPPNMVEAMSIEPGVNYANSDWDDLMVDVVTPSGAVVAIDDPGLIEMLGTGTKKDTELKLVRSDRALADCRPVSLVSMETIRHFEKEMDIPIDKRRFRSNIYVSLQSKPGFFEDQLVGRKLQIGSKVVISILERDPRCKMISIDPDTGEHNPSIFRKAVEAHDSFVGVYCAVLVEGKIAKGDSLEIID